MIHPVVFSADENIDDKLEVVAQSPTLISIMFTSDALMAPESAVESTMEFLRMFAMGMVADGTEIGIVCEIGERRTATTVGYRSPGGSVN